MLVCISFPLYISISKFKKHIHFIYTSGLSQKPNHLNKRYITYNTTSPKDQNNKRRNLDDDSSISIPMYVHTCRER